MQFVEVRQLKSFTTPGILRTWPLALDFPITPPFSSMAESRRERVICVCPRCHPGREVSLRTRQAHLRANRSSTIYKHFSGSPVILSDFGMGGELIHRYEYKKCYSRSRGDG